MLEEEIHALLAQAKTTYGSHGAAAKALNVTRSTFYSWIEYRKGLKEQPLFRALDVLGAHLAAQPSQTESKNEKENGSMQEKDPSLVSLDVMANQVLRAKIEGLEKQIQMLTAHNDNLQEQVRALTQLLLNNANKKEANDSTVASSLAKIS